jgi:hypothetical protein
MAFGARAGKKIGKMSPVFFTITAMVNTLKLIEFEESCVQKCENRGFSRGFFIFHIFAYNFLQTQSILMCYSSLCSLKNRLKHSTNLIKINFVFKKLLGINQLTAQYTTAQLSGSHFDTLWQPL